MALFGWHTDVDGRLRPDNATRSLYSGRHQRLPHSLGELPQSGEHSENGERPFSDQQSRIE